MIRELRLGSKRQAGRYVCEGEGRKRVKVTVEFYVALKEILVKLSFHDAWHPSKVNVICC